jgi:hypothetical protein
LSVWWWSGRVGGAHEADRGFAVIVMLVAGATGVDSRSSGDTSFRRLATVEVLAGQIGTVAVKVARVNGRWPPD